MGQWGWRRLIFAFVLVWVVACDTRQLETPTVTPTQYPPVTLIVRTSRTPAVNSPTGTLTSATPRAVATPAADASPDTPEETRIPTPTPLSLNVRPPDCYSDAGGTVLCLGLVNNPLDEGAERVMIWVELLDTDGSQLAARSVVVEQRHIGPGESAPYRATFAGDLESAGAFALIQRADSAPGWFSALLVNDERGELKDGHYAISASIDNAGMDAAYTVRAIITLQDSEQRVVGYRVVDVADMLAAGAAVPLLVEIQPLLEDSAYTHTLVVEAEEK